MSDTAGPFEKSGRLRLKGALIGGLLAMLGTMVAWVVVWKLIR